MRSSRASQLLALLLPLTLWPALALAQAPKAGVVTTLQGQATVARPVLPRPIPLRFKDDVLLQDRIDTRENSIVQVLLGGKALVTVRELSVFTITEEPGRAVVDLREGKLALGVAKSLMKPGESIEVRTPNAIAAVRGSFLVAAAELIGGVVRTTFTALEVTVPITVASRAAPTVSTPLITNTAVSISGVGAATTVGPVQTLTLGQAQEAAKTAQAPKSAKHTERPPEPLARQVSTRGVQEATQLATHLTSPREHRGTRVPGGAPLRDARLATATAPIARALGSSRALPTLPRGEGVGRIRTGALPGVATFHPSSTSVIGVHETAAGKAARRVLRK